MSEYPKKVTVNEVGPREGFQIEKTFIPTDRKLQLIDALSETGVAKIEITSFVSPKWVPQMADAEEVSKKFKSVPGVKYTPLYLNDKGLQRAAATGKYDIEGVLKLCASPAFSKKNTNKTIEETIEEFGQWIHLYQGVGVPVDRVSVPAAFGCNYQGAIPADWVLSRILTVEDTVREHGYQLKSILLSDTMGWTNPKQIREIVGKVKDRWPDVQLSLHLHDTRGPGLANVLAALEMGVSEFDASVGGLGGCPFAGHSAAAGNVCTEDLVFMCHEMGIETGVDLEKLIECARLAEDIVGHPLPGKVMKAGSLAKYRL